MLLHNLVTLRRAVLLNKLTLFELDKKFSTFCETLKTPLNPLLSYALCSLLHVLCIGGLCSLHVL
jgi:hypothetical protein